MIQEKSILWVDAEHIWAWQTTIKFLNERGFVITELQSKQEEDVFKELDTKRALILHCGTIDPMENIVEFLGGIKQKYSDMLVGLQTNVRHPLVDNLVDFYIYAPVLPSTLLNILNDVFE